MCVAAVIGSLCHVPVSAWAPYGEPVAGSIDGKPLDEGEAVDPEDVCELEPHATSVIIARHSANASFAAFVEFS